MKSTVTQRQVLLDSCAIQHALENPRSGKKLSKILHSMDAKFFVSTRTLFELEKIS